MTFAALASKLRSIAWRATRAPRDIARDGHAIDIAADRASEARAKADRNGRCWKYRCQLRVPDKRCKQTVCERERDKEGGRGSSYCPKFPSEYRKYRTSFLQVSFRGQKSSRIRDCDDLYFQVAQTLNNSIYIYIYDRASILFLPRVKLAQFSLTSNAWLSFEQLFKSVCLTLRLPRFFRYLTRFFYFFPSKVGTRSF